jgi:transposase
MVRVPGHDHGAVPPPRRRHRTDQVNALAFDVRAALFALLGKDITAIDGLGAYLSLKLIAECGDDLSSWPSLLDRSLTRAELR